ncbi:MAG TPA: FAD-binding protein [Burkholderiales bacterium]|nr:FAD-binding protein [Burkholderiales bacterium]
MQEPWDLETDVVVVGAGACGLMTTVIIASANTGLEVVLLEKNSRWGCNAEIAGGTIQGAGTRFQKQAGIDDSPEIMAADILRKNRGRSDPAVTRALCEKSAELVHWMVDDLGVPLALAEEIRRVGHTRPRMHAHPTRSGAPIVGALRERATSYSAVAYADETPGRALITDDDGSVIGVLAGPEGDTQRIRCKKVVLATDGFGASRDMLSRFIPGAEDMLYVGVAGNTGDGIRWGMEIGAATEHMHGYQGHGFVVPGSGTRLNPGIVMSGGIVVNKHARRFEREDQGYSEWAAVVLAQPDGVGITIWDERIHAEFLHSHAMAQSLEAGVIRRAHDIEALARQFRLDAETLGATIADYNRGIAERRDSLGRTILGLPLQPPFYGAFTTGALAHTLGGLKIDASGRVLRPDGSPVPNLYAGGGAAAGISGDTPDGYLSASGLLTAYGLGMIIGQHIVSTLAPSTASNAFTS